MLTLDLTSGSLLDPATGLVFADRPYHYQVSVAKGSDPQLSQTELVEKNVILTGEGVTIQGRFADTGLELEQSFRPSPENLVETLKIKNNGTESILIDQIELGFCTGLGTKLDWRLSAIPFKIQLDGSQHDYPAQALIEGQYHNAVFDDFTRKFMPPLNEDGRLRSEAWAWWTGERGLLVIKYNNEAIELSIAAPFKHENETCLRFGGAGFSLYTEPSAARRLEPGQEFTFGPTYYLQFEGGLASAFRMYRDFLDERGHTFPGDYNPPVNWNELYDVGWYHSRPDGLQQHYTRAALLGEAQKASEIGCELLYLDPGWEVCEGTTLWDEERLGSVRSLVEVLKKDYGLDLGYRTILRTYKDYWPAGYLVRHNDQPYEPIEFGDQYFWEPCLINPVFWKEKLERILKITRQGIRFMMVDETDWRGPCYASDHGHAVPTTPLDHVRAVYDLCAAIRKDCPDVTIECHDPVWPWSTSLYVPTYFQQGFGDLGRYDENWGFEYMWDCLNDLRSGRALALYYYNLGCNVPIYLHITMAADNDACVFFWWVASTVRHLGIGGKESSPTIEPQGGLPPRDKDKRFAAYKDQMKLYRRLKPYFVRGIFHGISETAHLHTLADRAGGVLNLFNLSDDAQDLQVFVPFELLNTTEPLPLEGAEAEWTGEGVLIRKKLEGMSPAVVLIGSL